jgi:hypothetical protein
VVYSATCEQAAAALDMFCVVNRRGRWRLQALILTVEMQEKAELSYGCMVSLGSVLWSL